MANKSRTPADIDKLADELLRKIYSKNERVADVTILLKEISDDIALDEFAPIIERLTLNGLAYLVMEPLSLTDPNPIRLSEFGRIVQKDKGGFIEWKQRRLRDERLASNLLENNVKWFERIAYGAVVTAIGTSILTLIEICRLIRGE